MGFFDLFRRGDRFTATAGSRYEVAIPSYTATYAEVAAALQKVVGMSPAQLWACQPNVRTVVDFLARNIGQLGLHVYQRVSDTDRQRLVGSPVAQLLARPNKAMTGYDLKASLVSDLALYDEAWWVLVDTSAGWELRPLAVPAVSIKSGSEIDGDLVVSYQPSSETAPVLIPGKNLIHFSNWSPLYASTGSPVVATLKDILAEQIAAQQFRTSMWKNGGQIGSYISRPKDAAEWSDPAAKRFREDMREYRQGGAKAGGMPVLEDGMRIESVRFNAREEQWIEAAQLSLETVARSWHINPAMLGATGGVSYANVREFRKMLYGETLGPWLTMIQDRINTQLVPVVDPSPGVYVEFNVKAKLAASFDEQAAVLSTATGRPWMTANEARALENMPALDGDADSLVTPLNVLVGGQASPRDSAPKASGPLRVKSVQLKGEPDEESAKVTAQVLKRFFKRQRAAVLSRLGSKAPDWWDGDRWDRELSDDLFKAAMSVTGQVASDVLGQLGIDPDQYDTTRTQEFLKAVSQSRAGMVNAATLRRLEDSLDADADDESAVTPEDVFDEAEGSRGDAIASTLLTTFAAFATTEAAEQTAPEATKTWVVNSGNPRSEHAAMDGETVPIRENFSNGAKWPGDPVLGADGVANCQCSVEINT